MAKQQRTYQVNGINHLARFVSKGMRKIIFQLATGGGKTVAFAGLIDRFLIKQQKRILILVHREELLKQAYKTIYDWYEIVAVPVTAGQSYLPNSMVYLSMVETANNRLRKNPDYFGNIGLVIVDECHLGFFKKLYEYFPDALIIGFTATPISASKNDPLKNHFQEIVCCVDIPELIELWKKDHTTGLVPNKTYHIQNIERKDLRIKNGEFDEREMGNVFSGGKHVQNCIKAYQEFALGTKTLVFNCNIDHSKKVNEAFLAFGYPSRHLDGNASESERKKTIEWFRNTPGAILNNVGILTAGFDEPSVISVIVNRSTMSLPLWLQMPGRGSRPYEGKIFFNIIDMGGNAMFHGDWSDPRDWRDIFHNPDKPKPPGEAPMKSCAGCSVLIHLSQKTCPHCGADNYKAPVYDENPINIQQLARERKIYINVPGIIAEYAIKRKVDGQPYKEIVALHEIKRLIINHAKRVWKIKRLDDQMAKILLDIYQVYVSDWCIMKGKEYDWWHKKTSKEWIYAEFKRVWNYDPNQKTVTV